LGACLDERFEVLKTLGKGGSGTVYLAQDHHLDQVVAVKVLQRTDPNSLERFRREARITACMDPGSVVHVFELEECCDHPFIVMEYLPGGNLEQAQLSLEQTVEAARQVAGALHHIHSRGVIHRDLKPENILLDSEGRARLADFGLARDLCGRQGSTLTLKGEITGTAWFMAPEQVRGSVEDIDARTDLHALGATLYYKLTGRRPFDGDTVVDVLHAVLHESPKPMELTLPKRLRQIVERCLEKKPEDRYQSAEELLADLDEFAAAGIAEGTWWSRWGKRLRGSLSHA
jgi:serine/threonine-protein kinase